MSELELSLLSVRLGTTSSSSSDNMIGDRGKAADAVVLGIGIVEKSLLFDDTVTIKNVAGTQTVRNPSSLSKNLFWGL